MTVVVKPAVAGVLRMLRTFDALDRYLRGGA